MDPIANPFSPGAGTPPPELVGRDDLIDQVDIALGRLRAGRSAKGVILLGLRGVGKTVLLCHLRHRAESAGCRALQMEAPEDKPLGELLVPHLRRLLLELDALEGLSQKVKRALRVLKSFVSSARMKLGDLELTIEPERGSADSGDLEADLGALLGAVGEAAQDRGTAVVLCLDEIQYLAAKDLGALVMALHQAGQRGLPLLLLGAGLPTLAGQIGRAKTYAERLFDFPALEALTPAQARRALQGPVEAQGATFVPEALDELVAVTGGYPYFLQQWGYEAWNLAIGPSITLDDALRASGAARRNLDTGFFRVRLARLTARERDYVRALATLGTGPQRSGEVAKRLGMPVTTAAPIRNSLIRKGMLYSPSHGRTAFTVPHFDDYLRRRVWPEDPKAEPRD